MPPTTRTNHTDDLGGLAASAAKNNVSIVGEKYSLRQRSKRGAAKQVIAAIKTESKSSSSPSSANVSSTSSCASFQSSSSTSSGGGRKPKEKSKQKAAPLSKYRRKTANARERSRMREINTAFANLRHSVPASMIDEQEPTSNEKLTKITTLRLAMKYIQALSSVLDMADGGSGYAEHNNNNSLLHFGGESSSNSSSSSSSSSSISSTSSRSSSFYMNRDCSSSPLADIGNIHGAADSELVLKMNCFNNNNNRVMNYNSGSVCQDKGAPALCHLANNNKRQPQQMTSGDNAAAFKTTATTTKRLSRATKRSTTNTTTTTTAAPNKAGNNVTTAPENDNSRKRPKLNKTLCLNMPTMLCMDDDTSPDLGLLLESDGESLQLSEPCLSPLSKCMSKVFNSTPAESAMEMGLMLDSDSESLQLSEPCLSPLGVLDAFHPFGDLMHTGFSEQAAFDLFLT